jgi:hypothetical protein
MRRIASEPGDALTLMLHQLRGDLAALLERSGRAMTEALAPPRGRPIIELSLPESGSFYRKPRRLPPLLPLARLLAGARLSPTLRSAVGQQLLVHGEALSRWGREYLDDLASQFNVSIAAVESIERFSSATSMIPSDTRAALEDLELLRNWPPGSA